GAGEVIVDPAKASETLRNLLRDATPKHCARIRAYCEVFDALWERGHPDEALRLEEIWRLMLEEDPRLSLLCGYSTQRLQSGGSAKARAVCRLHSHVIRNSPPAALGRKIGEGNSLLSIVVTDAQTAALPPTSEGVTPASAVYVIDDDHGMRRSLGRL